LGIIVTANLLAPDIRSVFSIDLRGLALFRVALGLILIADLAIRAPDLVLWLSDEGLAPREWILQWNHDWRFSLYFIHGHWLWAALLNCVAALSAMALILGYRTRLSSLISFVLLGSLHFRAPMLLQGGDMLLVAVLFWSMFLPLGARYSVDATLVRNRTSSAAVPLNATNTYLSVATAAILLQAMAVYFFSAWLKTGSEWQVDGTAIYYALHLDDLNTWFAQQWRDWHGITVPLTHYVWWLEVLGPLLIFSPWFNRAFRYLGVIAFVSLEIGFLLNLKIGLFPFISIATVLLFLPSSFWDSLQKYLFTPRRGRAQRLTIYYDQPCSFCEKSCHLLRTFLLLDKAEIRPAQSKANIAQLLEQEFSWVVENHAGTLTTKTAALAALLEASPVFFLLAPAVRFAAPLGDRIYHWIGMRREGFGRVFSVILPWRDAAKFPGLLSQLFAGAMLLSVMAWNIQTIPAWRLAVIEQFSLEQNARLPLEPMLRLLNLTQTWNMFAPYPRKRDSWLVVPGLTTEGDLVYLETGSPAMVEQVETQLKNVQVFDNYRWRKYLQRLASKRYKKYRQYYGRWLCDNWRHPQDPNVGLAGLFIYNKIQVTPVPGQTENPVSAKRIWRHWCTGHTKEQVNARLTELLGLSS
jgi:predicted DCC family thiol-disulfide oxidoreductase YuxK